MPAFRLNWLLISLVLFSALISLLISTGFILYRLDQNAINRVQTAAETALLHLTVQQGNRAVWQSDSLRDYPDFHMWQRSQHHSGLCVGYENTQYENIRSLCIGDVIDTDWPSWFSFFYLSLFNPMQEVVKPILYKGELEGYVRVSSSEQVELNTAWEAFKQLFDVALMMASLLCILLYFTLHIVLRPARVLKQSLQSLHDNGLENKVPSFKVKEWQMIASGVNQLAKSLEQTLLERQRLSLKLVSLQEEERQFLCRELHDELGQSLSGLSAVASFMNQQARYHSPELITSSEQVCEISQQMMQLVKKLMLHLRPADFDELGLDESLRAHVSDWNQKHHGIHCNLHIDGALENIPDAIAMNALRIVQECLTNISKHAEATEAYVDISYRTEPVSTVELNITDNGQLKYKDLIESPGKGLLGIRERVFALDGDLSLVSLPDNGLCVKVIIPLPEEGKEP